MHFVDRLDRGWTFCAPQGGAREKITIKRSDEPLILEKIGET
jgi:hypothetical protein